MKETKCQRLRERERETAYADYSPNFTAALHTNTKTQTLKHKHAYTTSILSCTMNKWIYTSIYIYRYIRINVCGTYNMYIYDNNNNTIAFEICAVYTIASKYIYIYIIWNDNSSNECTHYISHSVGCRLGAVVAVVGAVGVCTKWPKPQKLAATFQI